MGIDAGTSSLKTIVTDEGGNMMALASRNYQYDIPHPGFAQQEPDVWWDACVDSVRQALAQSGLTGGDIAAVGFSGQMHGVVMLDENGHSVRPAILHCDARSGRQVQQLNELLGPQRVRELLMNPIYTGFMLPSLLWVRENEPENFQRIRRVCLPKDYLKYRLAGHVSTDYSDASATLAFDIRKGAWSAEVLKITELDEGWFPPCHNTCSAVGTVSQSAAAATGLSPKTLVVAGGADAVMQGIGNGAVRTDIVTANIGSSGQVCFQSDVPVENPALTTNTFCGYQKGRWITMGAIMHAGLALKWFNSLFDSTNYAKLDAEAQAVGPGSGGLVFLPYLNGERTPHLDPDLSALFLGCSTGTTRAHMARAVMEGVAFALNECMEVCGGLNLTASSVVASGGGAKSPLWLQIQADVYGLPVRVAQVSEQAALGAAIAAGVGAGVYRDMEQGCAAAVRYCRQVTQPNPAAHQTYRAYYQLYKDAYTANRQLLERATRLGRGD